MRKLLMDIAIEVELKARSTLGVHSPV